MNIYEQIQVQNTTKELYIQSSGRSLEVPSRLLMCPFLCPEFFCFPQEDVILLLTKNITNYFTHNAWSNIALLQDLLSCSLCLCKVMGVQNLAHRYHLALEI